jgi:hypothetical protein
MSADDKEAITLNWINNAIADIGVIETGLTMRNSRISNLEAPGRVQVTRCKVHTSSLARRIKLL